MNEQSNCKARNPKQMNFFTRCFQGKQTIVSQVESLGVPPWVLIPLFPLFFQLNLPLLQIDLNLEVNRHQSNPNSGFAFIIHEFTIFRGIIKRI